MQALCKTNKYLQFKYTYNNKHGNTVYIWTQLCIILTLNQTWTEFK
jgi:hypothetical protein